jgi:hypothetical protein
MKEHYFDIKCSFYESLQEKKCIYCCTNFVQCSTREGIVSCCTFFIGRQKWAYLVEVSVVYIIMPKRVRHTQLARVITSGTLPDGWWRRLQYVDNSQMITVGDALDLRALFL